MGHVLAKPRFQRPIEAFDQCRLNVVVQTKIMTNVVFAEDVLRVEKL
jgi:hypothetical protein